MHFEKRGSVESAKNSDKKASWSSQLGRVSSAIVIVTVNVMVSEGKSGGGGEPRAPPYPTPVQCCVDCRMFRFRFSVWDWRVRSRGYVSVVTVQGAREWMRVSLWCSSAFHLSLYISACSRVISTLCVGDVSEGSSRCLRHEEEKSWQLIAQVDDNNRWPSSSCSHYQTWKYQRFCLVDTSFLCVPRICMSGRRQTAIN